MPRAPCTRAIQTSALMWVGVSAQRESPLMLVVSIHAQTGLADPVHWRRRSTPAATYQMFWATTLSNARNQGGSDAGRGKTFIG